MHTARDLPGWFGLAWLSLLYHLPCCSIIANPQIDLNVIWSASVEKTVAATQCTDCCDSRLTNPNTTTVCRSPDIDYFKQRLNDLRF
jgi:hypothetical protein